VALHGGPPGVCDGGSLTERLQRVAEAAEQVPRSLRSRLVPDEVGLEFGLKVPGGVNWFSRRRRLRARSKVTVKWVGNSASPAPSRTGRDPGEGMTSGDQAAVARAIAAMSVDERRTGSAVLVGPQYLITPHMCCSAKTPALWPGWLWSRSNLYYQTRGQAGSPAGRRVTYRPGPGQSRTDVTVPDLGKDRPGWLPTPVT
jgi:Trypsin-co-occurring domain 1